MTSRIFRLDILRALAILLVFTAHTVLSYGAPTNLAWMQFGGTGVDLFFVLSGWLIGVQLFKELSKYGDIQIRRFWIRRWLRTFPAYYCVLLLTIVQLNISKDNFSFPWSYFFFIQNYHDKLEFFTVSWSLCVEEQFYLIIAPLLLIIHRLSVHNRTLVLFMILLMPSVFRELNMYDSLYETHVRWDCCIMGIFVAHIRYGYRNFWNKISHYGLHVFMVSMLLYCSFFVNRMTPVLDIQDPSKLLLAFIFGGLLLWSSQPSYGKVFAEQIIMYISTRSYAIYLLHPDALAVTNRLLGGNSFIVYFSVALIISCLVSEVLYRIIEKPFMNVRAKFSWSQSRSVIEPIAKA